MRVALYNSVHGLHKLGLVELAGTPAPLTTSMMTVTKSLGASRLVNHSTELRIGTSIGSSLASSQISSIPFVLKTQFVLFFHITYLGLLLEHDLGQLQLVLKLARHVIPISLTY